MDVYINFSQVDLGDSNNTPVLFAFGVIVALQLFVIIRALFRLVDKIEYCASKKESYTDSGGLFLYYGSGFYHIDVCDAAKTHYGQLR